MTGEVCCDCGAELDDVDGSCEECRFPLCSICVPVCESCQEGMDMDEEDGEDD